MRLRVSTIVALSAALLSGTALLWTSQRVQMEDDRRHKLTEAVAAEKETIRVLAAEWAYLNRPERLEALAREHLAMAPPVPAQILPSPAYLPERFAPVLPGRKPSLDIRPAALSITAPPPVQPSLAVKPAPAEQAETKSFHSLLNELDGERR